MKELIVFDFDGVLASDKTTKHLAAAQDYEGFNKVCGDVEPNPVMVNLAKAFHAAGFKVRVHTARSREVEDVTRAWLIKYGLGFVTLVMRKPGDNRPAWLLKQEMLWGKRPALAFEDDTECIAWYKRIKVNVVRVHYGK